MIKYTKEELIGQKLLVGFEGKEVPERIVELIQKYKVGGIILYRKNYDTYYEMVSMIKRLKEINKVNRIPLFICVDQENGIVNRLTDEFHRIKNAYASSKCNKSVIREIGAITAEILSKSGINMNLAPVVDIYDDNMSKSIGNRCFGDNSKDVIKNARVIIEEHTNNNVVPIIKHYPGLRKVKIDTHLLLPSIKTIDKEDLEPFTTFINEDVPGILLSHLIVKDRDRYPVSLSKNNQKEIKENYEYKGITITDDLKMRSVRYRYGWIKSARLALEAGNDIIMFNYPERKEKKVLKAYYSLYKKHRNRIEESALRIIDLKKKYNVNDDDYRELSIDEINNYNDRIDKVDEIIINQNS